MCPLHTHTKEMDCNDGFFIFSFLKDYRFNEAGTKLVLLTMNSMCPAHFRCSRNTKGMNKSHFILVGLPVPRC